jgi:hypothetical protein
MLCKALHPDKFYVFGGLDHNTTEVRAGNHNYLQQARTLIELGVDGLKMWEGGFFIRQQTGLSLDSPVYDEYYSLLESEGLPVLYHVNAEYRPEIDRMLPKHPNLKIIFAHFYGGARDPAGLRRFLERWPNVYVDLTPGRIFRGLSDNRDDARKLFVDHQDRILLGTDTSASSERGVERGTLLVRFLRRLLERRDVLDLEELGITEPGDPDPSLSEEQQRSRYEFWAERGLYLDEDILAKVYAKNFLGIVGNAPRKANPEIALAECRRLIDQVSREPDDYWATDGMESHRDAHLDELAHIRTAFEEML